MCLGLKDQGSNPHFALQLTLGQPDCFSSEPWILAYCEIKLEERKTALNSLGKQVVERSRGGNGNNPQPSVAATVFEHFFLQIVKIL